MNSSSTFLCLANESGGPIFLHRQIPILLPVPPTDQTPTCQCVKEARQHGAPVGLSYAKKVALFYAKKLCSSLGLLKHASKILLRFSFNLIYKIRIVVVVFPNEVRRQLMWPRFRNLVLESSGLLASVYVFGEYISTERICREDFVKS